MTDWLPSLFISHNAILTLWCMYINVNPQQQRNTYLQQNKNKGNISSTNQHNNNTCCTKWLVELYITIVHEPHLYFLVYIHWVLVAYNSIHPLQPALNASVSILWELVAYNSIHPLRPALSASVSNLWELVLTLCNFTKYYTGGYTWYNLSIEYPEYLG